MYLREGTLGERGDEDDDDCHHPLVEELTDCQAV